MNNFVKPFNALIVDDEIEACKNLQALLLQCKSYQVNIIGIANNTAQAEKILSQILPDVIFLDIEMPEENAFQLLSRLGQVPFEIIFVTAYEDYAIKALKLNALDYILKPLCLEELNFAIQKLIERRYSWQPGEKIVSNFLTQFSKKNTNNSIVLRDKSEFLIVEIKNIVFIEAENSYARFHFFDLENPRVILMSHPLSYYEELLSSEVFFRAHKSYLVNYNFIQKLIRNESSSLLLKTNQTIPISRRRFQLLIDFLVNKKVTIY